jgi:hypothetical protein
LRPVWLFVVVIAGLRTTKVYEERKWLGRLCFPWGVYWDAAHTSYLVQFRICRARVDLNNNTGRTDRRVLLIIAASATTAATALSNLTVLLLIVAIRLAVFRFRSVTNVHI